jgi:3alpha(or 20beta)-hydroxysteroid dehydrogenase
MSDRFAGKTVIITGAAGALGVTMARAFASEGACVVLAARPHHETEATTLAEEIGNGSIFVALDVADEASWAAAISTIEARVGPVSVLINNAAILAVGGVEEVSLEDWRKVIDTNLTGDFLSIRAVAPSMRKRGGGSIVMISSIAALHPAPGLVAYSCSKWALRGLTRTAAYELARDNIRVNAIHPGIIETPLAYHSDSGEPLVPVDKFAIPRNADTAEIAKYVLFVASEDAAFSTASEFVADGGYALGPID